MLLLCCLLLLAKALDPSTLMTCSAKDMKMPLWTVVMTPTLQTAPTLKMLEWDVNVRNIVYVIKLLLNVTPSTACSNGEIRLEGGSSLYEGRVEICRNQQWGSVCDNSWTNVDATVVCRHLGYSGFGMNSCDLNIPSIAMQPVALLCYRCPSLLQCLLWSGKWLNLFGQCSVFWIWTWSLWLSWWHITILYSLWWCWSSVQSHT